MHPFLQRHPTSIPLALSFLALVMAYIAEYGFGLKPCHLCLYQRIPYAIVIAVASIGLVMQQPSLQRIMVYLCVLILLGEAGFAFYHAGVEQGIFTLHTGCDSGQAPTSLEALRAQILSTPAIPCDKPAFVFLGLSMAGWNSLYAFTSAILSILIFRKGLGFRM